MVHLVEPSERKTTFASPFAAPHSGPGIGAHAQLVVPTASGANWSWHYYGRSQTDENRCTESYAVENGLVTFERTWPLNPGSECFGFAVPYIIELL